MCSAANNDILIASNHALLWEMADWPPWAVRQWYNYENKFGERIIKQLLNSVNTKHLICQCLWPINYLLSFLFWWIIDLLAIDNWITILCSTSSNDSVFILFIRFQETSKKYQRDRYSQFFARAEVSARLRGNWDSILLSKQNGDYLNIKTATKMYSHKANDYMMIEDI